MAFWQLIRFRVIYPLVLFLLLFLDGNLMSSLGGILNHFPFHILPLLTLIWLFYAIEFEVTNRIAFWVYVVLIGLLFDIYYTGILGSYTIAFLAACVVMDRLRPYFDERLMSGLLLCLIGLIIYLLVTYAAGFIINIADVSLGRFLLYELVPTVVLNIIIAALGYYPAWSLFQVLS
ncbi:rod shape-determining protein MreD [Convivina intestini]|uniref:rod shape-determining protein MreD n=1 Tax=Convivina intestini TaxID=1505726 RepID=UPI0020107C80|nr:rod shape-determining protein MreD [Convivina intestini]CAH1856394.1 hypothetical protein R078131_01401 [Convivina intestini]